MDKPVDAGHDAQESSGFHAQNVDEVLQAASVAAAQG